MTERLRKLRRVVRAVPEDVEPLAAFIQHHADLGEVLPRTVEDIHATLHDWWLVRGEDGLLACGSIWEYGPHLAEVRTLLVHPAGQGQGWGRAVLDSLKMETVRRGIDALLTVTTTTAFFARCGFLPVALSAFPDKVRKDCVGCALYRQCTKEALVFDVAAAFTAAGYPLSQGVASLEPRVVLSP
jgi:amino-acid N-acetyltransferase